MRPAAAFDAVGAVMSYVRARGVAPEEDVIRVMMSREDEHDERQGSERRRTDVGKALATMRLLGDLVSTDRLCREDREGTTVYSVPRAAVVCTQLWAGYNEVPVTVLGETPKRYRCRWEETSLGRSKGSIRLVPKHAVKLTTEETPK